MNEANQDVEIEVLQQKVQEQVQQQAEKKANRKKAKEKTFKTKPVVEKPKRKELD